MYQVSGILNSKGQKFIGNWALDVKRYDLGMTPACYGNIDRSSIKMLYLESSYDLSELLFIRSLGFNTINHYCYFGNGTEDHDGTVFKLLDNAKSAGLMVNLGTEGAEATEDLNKFVSNYQGHSATFGFSVYDEPGTRNISLIQQNSKLSQMRNLTGKPLSMVDLIVGGTSVFYDYWSKDYDIVFVDSYAQRYESGTMDDWLKKDKNKNRIDFGGVMSMTKCQTIIPVVGLFTSLEDNSQYTHNEQ
ncbi:hypothetical protein KKI93_19940 [Xenorhabdus bovienii]|uniref:hypothetical protein n=1 Tax=Xenorhabdus bovienii TaxID=40576 RepID=UPI0023B28B39|nr:hypothetical protein [Xenorhabdus bovienii]MDE9566248.1 hypothetical protein [Xenorhabdus bovienii]